MIKNYSHLLLSSALASSLALSASALSAQSGDEPDNPATQAGDPPAEIVMNRGDGSGGNVQISDDQDFLEYMITHHNAAITASQAIIDHSANSNLISFAQGLIDEQSKELSDMKRWYADRYDNAPTQPDDYKATLSDSTVYTSGDEATDILYIDEMIKHHEASISAANQALGMTDNNQVRDIAESIINTQTREIELLESWKIARKAKAENENNESADASN